MREGAMRAQERVPNYPVVAAWPAFLIFIGAGTFALGMAIHAKPPAPRPEPVYYCATDAELPAFEPCKDRKDESDIDGRPAKRDLMIAALNCSAFL
jgi:hypothetical protein